MTDEQGHKPGGAPRAVHLAELVRVRVNHTHDRVSPALIRRVFRNDQGDWCAEIAGDEQSPILVFDHHPTVTVLNILKGAGAAITDAVVNQGAEGSDMRQHARRSGDR